MTAQDRKEFRLYLRTLTDVQVRDTYEREQRARRHSYAQLATEEQLRRFELVGRIAR